MLKAVTEISDTLLKSIGTRCFENFCRAFQVPNMTRMDKSKAMIALSVYTVLHSIALLCEMLLMHVILTSSEQACFSFALLNGFAELKMSVFKKCDIALLVKYTADDCVE